MTNKSLDLVNVSFDGISKITNNLDLKKSLQSRYAPYKNDKIVGNSNCKPLLTIFNDWLKKGTLPADWEKAHVVPVHKKGDQQFLKNHWPISLLSICSKNFERLICSELVNFFTDNKLISPNQFGFRPADSCVNQLLSITHEIYKPFDDGLEVRGVS